MSHTTQYLLFTDSHTVSVDKRISHLVRSGREWWRTCLANKPTLSSWSENATLSSSSSSSIVSSATWQHGTNKQNIYIIFKKISRFIINLTSVIFSNLMRAGIKKILNRRVMVKCLDPSTTKIGHRYWQTYETLWSSILKFTKLFIHDTLLFKLRCTGAFWLAKPQYLKDFYKRK